VLLFLPGSARLRPETPDLTIRLVLQDRVLTATTRQTLSDTAPVRLRLRPPRSKTIVVGKLQRAIGHQGEFSLGPAVCQTDRRRPLRQGPIGIPSGWPLRKWLVRQRVC
jgi:hypothetical protein